MHRRLLLRSERRAILRAIPRALPLSFALAALLRRHACATRGRGRGLRHGARLHRAARPTTWRV